MPPLNLVHANNRTVRSAFGKQSALGGEIAAHAVVTIQMVGRQVGEDRHIGGQAAGKVGLVRGQFQHHHLAVSGGVKVKRAAPDVATHLGGAAAFL